MINRFEGRYNFLSNFFPCKIEHQGITYPSVEHYYVAMKCNNDQMIDGVYYTPGDFREKIAKTTIPAVVKKIGQRIKIRSDWDSKKLGFMEFALNQKFKIPEIKEMLLQTENKQLIEGNFWHDNFWGQCSCDKCSGKGKNNLGKLLMEIRSELNGTKKPNLYDVLFKK